MKLLFLKLAWSNIRNNKKKNILSILAIALCLTIIIICSIITFSFNQYKEDLIEATLCRTLLLQGETSGDILHQLPNVDKVIDPFADNWMLSLTDSTKQFSDDGVYHNKYAVLLTGYFEGLIPEVISGDNIKPGMKNVAIIPEAFQPSILVDSSINKNQQVYLNGRDLIGETLTGVYSKTRDDNSPPSETNIIEYTYQFEVIGVYDATKYHSSIAQVYIPMDDLITINDNLLPDYIDKNDPSLQKRALVVDKSANVDKVMNLLQKNDILALKQADPSPALDKSNILSQISLIVTLISLSFFVISIIAITNINIKKRKQEIGLLKTMGYSKKNIITILLIESMIVSFIASIFACFTSMIVIFSLWDVLLYNVFQIYVSTLSPDLRVFLFLMPLFCGICLVANILCTLIAVYKAVALTPHSAVTS